MLVRLKKGVNVNPSFRVFLVIFELDAGHETRCGGRSAQCPFPFVPSQNPTIE